MEIQSHSAKETKNFAASYSKNLIGGDILVLKGDLGTGKTTFTQGLAAALNIKDPVTSPTFIGMQLYEVANHHSIKSICHIDAYRFQSIDDAISSGIEDYIGKPEILTIIEWPEQLFGFLKQPHKTIELSHIEETTRQIKILE